MKEKSAKEGELKRAKRCRMRQTSEKMKESREKPDKLNVLANDMKV